MNGEYRVYQNNEEIVVEVPVPQDQPASVLVEYVKRFSGSH